MNKNEGGMAVLILISGGSGSGKSAFAENLIVSHATSPLLYIATMKLWDDECVARAEKHRQMRHGKGFSTVECSERLEELQLPTPCSILLEDLSNLTANEYFGEGGAEGAEERVFAGLQLLEKTADLVVVVTNELFSDGISYDQETTNYLNALANLNRRTAALASQVYEVVAGIPICWKGES